MKNSLLKTTALALLVVGVAACAATRTQESAGETIDDSVVTTRVKAALVADPETKERQISVDTFRGTVALSGFVDSSDEKTAAAQVARGVQGVKSVRNELTVGHTDRSTGQVVDDSVITTKVKAALIKEPMTKARQIDVETRQGIVQLSGFVDSTDERSKATEVAANVDGVKSVDNALQIKHL